MKITKSRFQSSKEAILFQLTDNSTLIGYDDQFREMKGNFVFDLVQIIWGLSIIDVTQIFLLLRSLKLRLKYYHHKIIDHLPLLGDEKKSLYFFFTYGPVTNQAKGFLLLGLEFQYVRNFNLTEFKLKSLVPPGVYFIVPLFLIHFYISKYLDLKISPKFWTTKVT